MARALITFKWAPPLPGANDKQCMSGIGTNSSNMDNEFMPQSVEAKTEDFQSRDKFMIKNSIKSEIFPSSQDSIVKSESQETPREYLTDKSNMIFEESKSEGEYQMHISNEYGVINDFEDTKESVVTNRLSLSNNPDDMTPQLKIEDVYELSAWEHIAEMKPDDNKQSDKTTTTLPSELPTFACKDLSQFDVKAPGKMIEPGDGFDQNSQENQLTNGEAIMFRSASGKTSMSKTNIQRRSCKKLPAKKVNETSTQEKKLHPTREQCTIKQNLRSIEKSCKVCSDVFTSMKKLYAHTKTHAAKSWTCNICKVQFVLKHYFDNHVKQKVCQKSNKCDTCEKHMQSVHQLKYHMKFVHENESREWKCKVCSRAFYKESHLKVHSRIHTGERPYVCKICGAGFTQRSNLTRHSLTHSDAKPFHCPNCDYRSSLKESLKTHIRFVHDGIKDHKCQICGDKFTTLAHLQRHERVHARVKPFSCKVCENKFSDRPQLKSHERVHTGETPYECDQCEKKFTCMSNLRRHKKYIHSEEKPFVCNICEKGFKVKGALTKHIRNHTGEKPYQCLVCSKRFSSSSYLSRHTKTNHMARKCFECSNCNKKYLNQHTYAHHMKRIHGIYYK